MKEKPILFSTPMIQAILDERKSMTRRVVKPQPLKYFPKGNSGNWQEPDWFSFIYPTKYQSDTFAYIQCPYGQVGDRLWVRETFKYADFCLADIGELYPRIKIEYKSDSVQKWINGKSNTQISIPDKWRPSIFMPRWASRITLEITNIKVERLTDITEEDTLKEGIKPFSPNGKPAHSTIPRQVFAHLWDSINAKRGYPFNSDHWVWVIEFKRV